MKRSRIVADAAAVNRHLSQQQQSSATTTSASSSSPVDYLHRHAAALNNVGATLFQHGDAVTAMLVLQRSVQTLMQAETSAELKLMSEEKINEMEVFLNSMMEKTQQQQVVLQGSHACASVAGAAPSSVATASGTPTAVAFNIHDTKTPSSMTSALGTTKSMPGLIRPVTRFKLAARRPGDSSNLTLSFPDPFFIQMMGKTESSSSLSSGSSPKKRRVEPFNQGDDLNQVSMSQTSVSTLFNMGLIHVHWGSVDSAVQLFQLALSVSNRIGDASPKLLNPIALAALSNIGQCCCHLGRIEEAVNFFEDAMARGNASLALLHEGESESEHDERGTPKKIAPKPKTDDATLAKVHCILARVLINLSCAKFTACNYSEAQRACEDAQRLLHAHQTDMEAAVIFYNIAMVQEYQQNRLQAIDYYDKFLDAAVRLVGPDHPNIADAMLRKGCVYYDIGQLHKALPPLLRALTIRLRHYGDHHSAVADVYHQIGKVLQAREEYEDALSSLNKALNIQRELFQRGNDGEVWLQLAETLLNVGRLHHAQGKIFESLHTYREVVSISVGIFGEHHPQIARMHVIVANLELELGHVSQSLSNFTEAARIELDQGRPVESTSKVQNRLARVALLFHPAAAAA